jgi:hypothetical protein
VSDACPARRVPLELAAVAPYVRDMETDRDREREEVFERIPWETLQQPRGDNSRMVIYLAGAVVVGALAYAFVRDQPAPVSLPAETIPTTTPLAPAVTVPPPILRSEADLYAVDHEQLMAHAAAHAEWFAVEFISLDGSDSSRATLAMLLPQGIPLPEAPSGTQVFVDWARAIAVSEVAPLTFEVEVVLRSMAAEPDGGFVRQPPTTLMIEVAIGPDGKPRVVRPPTVGPAQVFTPHLLGMVTLPDEIRDQLLHTYLDVVGGEPLPDGRWRVVVLSRDPDGVIRPRSVSAP